MSVLSIDIGTYSVKFLECEVGKKNFSVLAHREIPLQKVLSQFGPEASIQDVQLSIVKTYLENGHDGKVLMQLPPHMVTSRYLKLPIANRKKAEMMVPFQLDENLPFPISQAQHTLALRKRTDGFDALVTISKNAEFESFHEKLEKLEVLPTTLSSVLNFIDTFAKLQASVQPYAIIDIGHTTTKAYFISGGEVVANHISHTAGRIIDDVISKTYAIPLSEAVAYKQANAFFLTEAQYQEVSAEQREFANLMKQTMWPLVAEIRRWELGFRVKYGQSIDSIFICGGTARTNNIANFLSQAVGIKVELLDLSKWQHVQDDAIEESALSMCNLGMMCASQIDKEPVPNFLSGAYANSLAGQLPLYSLSFLSVRVAALCLLLVSFMLVERFVFLEQESKIVDAEVIRSLKIPSLGLPITERRYYPSQPQRVLAAVKKKTIGVTQEVKLVQAATKRRGLAPLVEVSNALASHGKTKVAFFEAEDGNARIVLTSEDQVALTKAQEALSSAGLDNFQAGPGKSDNEVTITFNF